MIQEQLIRLFYLETKTYPTSFEPIIHSGSSQRQYFRLKNEKFSFIGLYHPHEEINQQFLFLTKNFLKKELSVPKIYQFNKHPYYYLLEDLGSQSLYSSENRENLYLKTLPFLAKLHFFGAKNLKLSSMSSEDIEDIFSYFCYSFLGPFSFSRKDIEKDLKHLKKDLLKSKKDFFIMKDCQSRNILWHDQKPYFIDYQSGQKGSPLYDLASLFDQASVSLEEDFKEKLLSTYLHELEIISEKKQDHLKNDLIYFRILRNLQVLGTYGLHGVYKRNLYFLNNILPALKNFKYFTKDYPQLNKLADPLLEKFQKKTDNFPEVIIQSFSYHQKVPQEGFNFDCRVLYNPGRLPEYEKLTGLDEKVIHFLNQYSENFLKPIYQIIDESLRIFSPEKYGKIVLNFGCTGGQHRSVYCAEKIKLYLENYYNIKCNAYHLNKLNWKI